MDEDPAPSRANSRDLIMADDNDTLTDTLEVREDIPKGLGSAWGKSDWKIFSMVAIVPLLLSLVYLLACPPPFLISCLAVLGSIKGKALCSDSVPVCIYTEGATGLLNVVPLPHDVTQMAHRPMLDELRDLDKLPTLVAAQSDVRSSVKMTNQELTKRLACALKKYSHVDSKKEDFALSNEINLVSKQVRYTWANTSWLYTLYSSVQPAYHEYNSTITKALERTQLDSRKSLMITAQPLILKLVGVDFEKMYWDPWKENEQIFEKIQPSIVALEKELERLGRIDKVTREVGGSLDILADTLISKDVNITHDADRLLWQDYASNSVAMERRSRGSKPRESWPKRWFWQHVARYVEEDEKSMANAQFDRWWIELDCWCKK